MKPKSQTAFILASCLAVVTVFMFFLEPTQTWWFPACPLHSLTGLYCPGCGSTRALHSLLHGEFARAFRFNPLAVIAPLLLGAIAVAPRATWRPTVGWTILAVVILFGVLRNIPLQILQVLRP